MRNVNQERVALLALAGQIESEEDHFCPLCIRQNKGFFILCCSAFTILTIGIIFIIIRVPEVKPNLPTDIIITGRATKGKSQVLEKLQVNLDDAPEERWVNIGQKYKKYGHYISKIASLLRTSSAYSELQRIANGSSFENIISNYTSPSFLAEIKSYAKHLSVSYEDLIIFNLLYSYHMQSDISIVSDDQNNVWQKVYLASAITSNTPEFYVEVDFYIAGKIVFQTISTIGLVGTQAGVRLWNYTLSLSLKYAPEVNCDITKSTFVSSLAVRQVLSEIRSYKDAREHLSKSSYTGKFVLGGAKPEEAAVIKNLCPNDIVLSSQDVRQENPVYMVQMTASSPTHFEALCWTFNS